MPPELLIRLLPDDATEWLARSRDGRVLAGPRSGLPSEAGERTTVIVPAEDALLLQAPRVARQRRQLEQALPFAIEEQLAAPVEQMHVAFTDAQDGGDGLQVAVVAHARMQVWLERLRGAGIEPDVMLPESLLLPVADGIPSVLVESGRAVLRAGAGTAFAGHVSEVGGWLKLLRGDGISATRLRWFGDAQAAPEGFSLQHEAIEHPLTWMAAQLANGAPINLLQGRYAPRRGREGAHRLWRWAALLAAIAILLGLGQVWLESHQLERRQAQIRIEMEQLLRDALPGTTRIVDPKAQLSAEYARLGRGGSDAGAAPLLAKIAPLMSGSGRYTLDGLEFRGDTLDMIVRTSDVAALDSLRESLAALPSLQVELTGLVPGSGGVEGRLRIRSGAP